MLHPDHIKDPIIRPMNDLFRDHFLQGVLKHVKGKGEPTWDHEDASGDGRFDLSRKGIWESTEGKERLELELSENIRLHKIMMTDK